MHAHACTCIVPLTHRRHTMKLLSWQSQQQPDSNRTAGMAAPRGACVTQTSVSYSHVPSRPTSSSTELAIPHAFPSHRSPTPPPLPPRPAPCIRYLRRSQVQQRTCAAFPDTPPSPWPQTCMERMHAPCSTLAPPALYHRPLVSSAEDALLAHGAD